MAIECRSTSYAQPRAPARWRSKWCLFEYNGVDQVGWWGPIWCLASPSAFPDWTRSLPFVYLIPCCRRPVPHRPGTTLRSRKCGPHRTYMRKVRWVPESRIGPQLISWNAWPQSPNGSAFSGLRPLGTACRDATILPRTNSIEASARPLQQIDPLPGPFPVFWPHRNSDDTFVLAAREKTSDWPAPRRLPLVERRRAFFRRALSLSRARS